MPCKSSMEVNASLQQTHGDLSAYEAELEAQLRMREAEKPASSKKSWETSKAQPGE